MQIRASLTKSFIKFLRHGTFTRIEKLPLPNGKDRDIYLYSLKNHSTILGQTTPWLTTIVSEEVFANKPLFNLVGLHESRHASQWFQWPLLIFIALGAVIEFGVQRCVTGLLFLLLLMAYSWVCEFDADFAVMKIVGIEEFRRITARSNKVSRFSMKNSLISLWVLLTHRPRPLIVGLFELMHKNGSK
jgi:hypothetical protein